MVMGAVEADAGKLDESLKLFAEAAPLVGKDINFSVDYARMLAMVGTQQKDDAKLKEAFERFEGVYKESPQNVRNLQNWAIALFALGRYAEAWDKVQLAEASPDKGLLDPKFVEALQAKMAQLKKWAEGSGLPTTRQKRNQRVTVVDENSHADQ